MSKIALQGNASGSAIFTLQPPATTTNRSIILPDQDGTLAIAENFSVPIGSILFATGTTAPAGYVIADGGLLNRTTYPDLWAYAQSSGNLAASDAVWTKGQYSPGDGVNTFRVMDLRDQFIRGASGTRPVGNGEEDALKAHTHLILGGTGTTSGGVAVDTTATLSAANDTPTGSTGDEETRPKNVALLPCIRAYHYIVNPAALNAADVIADVNNKLNKNENIVLGTSVTASGTAVDFVGIPAGVKRITVMFDGVSTSGTSNLLIRVGDGSLLTTGYESFVANDSASSSTSNETGFVQTYVIVAADLFKGACEIVKTGTSWVTKGIFSRNNNNYLVSVGRLTLGDIKMVRITTVNGTDTFDAGTINISWEF